MKQTDKSALASRLDGIGMVGPPRWRMASPARWRTYGILKSLQGRFWKPSGWAVKQCSRLDGGLSRQTMLNFVFSKGGRQ